ncbi:type II toxin-antitoxin system HipA family toxin [Rhodovibrio salinarum]|uniref:Type II toxin-antitoxin system HipA family toxin n=1 Tax=Rhodovibrio salinarum TaxID=1087 RepID=A0A934UYN3_9PROT|nr:type II toxin-antitoxin system HipA family toxin [Rhodovibrio salinarum]MBK1696237.1 type II toxin-antitoxin system HipA family toxin [Rhodovibrio salinarum]
MSEYRLTVYLEQFQRPVGTLVGYEDYTLHFSYERAYGELEDALPLSLRMPLSQSEYTDLACRAFFQNLLLEGRRLDQVADREGLDRDNVAGLLSHLGQECPGAISIVPEGNPPGKQPGIIPDDYREIEANELAAEVRAMHEGKPPRRNRRISLAGVQGKLAVTVGEDGRLYETAEGVGAPTTHVLKVGDPDYHALVENEYICLKLARRLGLDAAHATIGYADDVPYLLVERFDRYRDSNGYIHRRHQEDTCQALGLPGTLKYEEHGHGDRRATLDGIFDLLGETVSPIEARQAMISITVFNYLIANFDAHAKNFALLYQGRRPHLAPFYDIVSTGVYPDTSKSFALSIGGKQDYDEIGGNEWGAFLNESGIRTNGAQKRVLNRTIKPLVEGVLPELDTLLEEENLEHRGRRIRNLVGAGIRNLNDAFGWSVPADTDAPVATPPGWRMS